MIKMFDRPRRLRILLAVLLLASITIITIDFRSAGDDGPLDKLGRGALTVIGPVQRGLVTIFRPVGDFLSGFTKVPSLRTRIQTLEGELATLRAERDLIEDVARENESLRSLLALQERLNVRTQAAQVIGVSPSNFERVIFIDRGRTQGVAVDMPVVTGEGLVGRVTKVGPDTAQVLLLTDRSSSVAARLATNGKIGVLEGQGSATLRLELLDPATRVDVGDRVVTSGYDRGLFPPGLALGTVVSAPEAGANLSRVVSVEPFIDFSSLDYVLLVVGEKRSKGGGR